MSWLANVVSGGVTVMLVAAPLALPAAFAIKQNLGTSVALKALLKGLSLFMLPSAVSDVYEQIFRRWAQGKTESEVEAANAKLSPLEDMADKAVEPLREGLSYLPKRLVVLGCAVAVMAFVSANASPMPSVPGASHYSTWEMASFFAMLGFVYVVISCFGVTLARPLRNGLASFYLLGNPFFVLLGRLIGEMVCFAAEVFVGMIGLPYVMFKFTRASFRLLKAATNLK